MSAMSNYLEAALLAHIFQNSAYTGPTTVYVALGTAGADGSFTELSGNGYARVGVTCNSTNWAGPTGNNGTVANGTAITFPAPSGGHWNGGSSFGYFAIFDASSSGNMLFWGALDTAQTVLSTNSAPSIAIGSLSIQIDN